MSKWSVIACDQHTSEPDYWDGLSEYIGDAPSTLRLMIPEAYLGRDISIQSVNAAMSDYLAGDVFREIKDSFIYVERTLPNGKVRRGLVGALNLQGNLLSTEGIVEERLPARIAVRRSAPLEMPHAMIFSHENLFDTVQKHEQLYDFELNAGGGHIIGYRADADTSCITELAVGDGNHSIAAAKRCGDGSALAELVDINDDAIEFEPIHRVVFGCDTGCLDEKIIRMDSVAEADDFCRNYIARHGGYIDYIHDDETAISMSEKDGCFAVLLPPFDKSRLFDDIRNNGAYPKKSFSIGHASDKRYYLECRKININD